MFYHTLPDEKNIPRVLKQQERFVDKVLSYTLRFDNVLYCMDNETGGSPSWGAYWAHYIRNAATKAGKKVWLTEMFESHDLNHPVYHNVTDFPETYDFIEISQNNHQSGQTHYDKIQVVRQRVLMAPRPLSNVKIYGSDGSGLFGTSHEATERFWRIIFAGCASARFHEKHLGDSELAQRMIRGAREVTSAFDLFHCAPHNELLLEWAPNRAYCMANPGTEYVVYFPEAARVQLDTSALHGQAELRWYNIDRGRWVDATPVQAQEALVLSTPSAGQWAVIIRSSAARR
jgi:Putative collagen-binding domain of a collagenase